jgi:hypothetical protein
MSKFHVQFRNYRKYCKTINWEKECPDLDELGKKMDEDGNKVPINIIRDLWKAKMGPVLRGITDLIHGNHLQGLHRGVPRLELLRASQLDRQGHDDS